MLAQLKGGVNMVVKGYYIWVRNDGVFDTRFLPTTDFSKIEKYITAYCLEYFGHCEEEKTFSNNEKEGLFYLMLELNNI